MATHPRLVLLTGAAGFVGRQVLRVLGERGCRVRAVVRQANRQEMAREGEVESVVASSDIFAESSAWWEARCRDVDTAIHAAWYAEPAKYLHSPKNAECLAGTLRFAEGAVEAGLRRFVGIGTCFEYDLSAGRLSIDTPLKPSTPYAQAKVEAFNRLSAMLPSHGVEFAWCRLFYLYGEGEDPRRLVSYLRAKLQAGEPAELSSGVQVRDFLDVREAARMIVDAALGPATGPINICSGRPVTVREVAERIADEFGRRDLLRFGARPDNPVDPPCVIGVRDP
ncbi:MAG TPA: NAD(P)-dependent oxidoreductase [Pseudolabrys sp.]|nr:NAD(P)-dependent oxidoreductase [Pseudolabrys sp.]